MTHVETKCRPIFVERYGEKVWENTKMDALRKEECLCLNCDRIGKLELCKKYNLAFAMTRCKSWIQNGGEDGEKWSNKGV